ncbi:P-loop containing nucleoside triphosphate hydrolases superfamily protein [Rhynchospora pubera]|uniref:P-loop containing nucleoside triphosphate hydrolases superfamily protein n=1 Tax=Rhynchospora pubera TaxID=906938 RepID=A0AAV8BRU0_9POAL|nr:P-loop containing nucleoside triphosphate hydrolases superfamily protein [Rhynchospora pubera]
MEFLSQMWSLLGLLTILQNVLPSQLLSLLHSLWQSLQDSLTPYSYFDVPEFLGSASVEPNDLYRHVHLYLHQSVLSSPSLPPPRLTVSLPRSNSNLSSASPSLSLSPNHSLDDTFNGHHLVWTLHADTLQDSLEERRSFSLRLPKRHASTLLPAYLAHVSNSADSLERSSRTRRLHTNSQRGGAAWMSVPFRHPATFDTLALDPSVKSQLLADLSAFSDGKEFYHRTGRPWKRGYLLHGPPGTGKSSLIAAMANYLRYDVYDLELTRVTSNSDLRELLIQTTNRSVIVIEDIDCSLQLTGDRRNHQFGKVDKNMNKRQRVQSFDDDSDFEDYSRREEGRVTLSGLLNFTDGLWSCCGEERIIVFTTNFADGIDPALLRAGRMDVHVRLGHCGAHAVRQLVERYVGVREHHLLDNTERYIQAGAEMTPAEVGEVLLRNREAPETAVRELVAELQRRAGASGEEEDEGWEDSGAESSEGSSEKKGKKGKPGSGWEGKVRFLGRLRSLTKSDSGRRGV